MPGPLTFGAKGKEPRGGGRPAGSPLGTTQGANPADFRSPTGTSRSSGSRFLNGRNNLPNPANVGYQSLRGGTGTVGGQPLQGAGVVGGAEQLGSQLRPNPASNFAGDIARINDPTAAPLPGTTQGAGNFGGAASLNTNVPPTFVPRRRQGNTDLATFLASSRTF